MAEGLFRKLVSDRQDIEIASAGISASEGSPASINTTDILEDNNASLADFSSQQLTLELLEWATHVACMTEQHAEIIKSHFPEKNDVLYLVTEFCSTDSVRGLDVPDPYGGNRLQYEKTKEILQQSLPDLLSYIDTTSS